MSTGLDKVLLVLTAVFLVSVVACRKPEKEASQEKAATIPIPSPNPFGPAAEPPNSLPKRDVPSYCTVVEDAKTVREDLLARFSDNHPDVVGLTRFIEALQEQCSGAKGNNQPSGNWHIQNGIRVCDGYIVRNANEEYCASEVPEDWVPYPFDGQEYYVQPLTHPDYGSAILD